MVITCGIAIILKLTACTIQQKLIGEFLGSKESVQYMVGVHTPFIHGIRKLLSKPKITRQKVFILCGGPDWPTSVLAGILHLPLVPCLIGTLPCFFLSSSTIIAGAMMSRSGDMYSSLGGSFMALAVGFNLF